MPELRLRLGGAVGGQCDSTSRSHSSSPGRKRPLRQRSGLSVSNSSDSLDGRQSGQGHGWSARAHSQFGMHHPGSPSKSPTKAPASLTAKLARKINVRYSTMFLIAMFAIGSLQRLHYLAVKSAHNENVQKWGAPSSHLRPIRRRIGSGHSRIIDISGMAEGTHRSSQFWSVWGTLVGAFPFLSRKVRIHDPMLHHEGWKPSDDEDPTSLTEGEPLNSGNDEAQIEEEEQCVPMMEWQTTSYPNCNSVHEIDLVRSSGMGSMTFPQYLRERHRRRITQHPPSLHKKLQEISRRWPGRHRKEEAKQTARGIMFEEDIEFLGQGWFRAAWEVNTEGVPDWDWDEEEFQFDESVVLKTLRIEREFLEEYYELHRRDALAMERLTFSPYVLDIYGYCGQSAINELANFGIEGMSNLEKVARSFRNMDHIEPVSKIKLQLASMVAAGVSHMHSIDYPDFPEPEDDESRDTDHLAYKRAKIVNGRVVPNATLVHYDLNPRNIAVVRRGKPKLNDFNVAEFLTWNPKTGKQCGFKGRFREPWWRAPEEMHYHLDNYTDPEGLTEKVDVYSLGNILWDILTTHSPRGKMKKELEAETRPMVARGELPKWPSDFNTTKLERDPALKAIERAMRKCLRLKPEDRPTAGEIADELSVAIDNLPEGFGDKDKWRAEMARQEEIKRLEDAKKRKERKEKNAADNSDSSG
ncbi:hypothetical protein ACHAXT_009468 [Thalassiosira profunda]